MILTTDRVVLISPAFNVPTLTSTQAYDLLHPQMIEFLMGVARVEWQFAGNMVLLHRSGTYEPDELAEGARRLARAVADYANSR